MTSLKGDLHMEPVIGILAAAVIIRVIDFFIGTEKTDEKPTT